MKPLLVTIRRQIGDLIWRYCGVHALIGDTVDLSGRYFNKSSAPRQFDGDTVEDVFGLICHERLGRAN
ncbi:MAG: hypothetical protein JO347_07490 [Candidatus Eremiobacteraeota bacterium]|nr:hypothetical protein [Candidatus Eremiobacteraeota bacterium]MBV8281890.1 hypothetical protein [Candidatus Eremiobacteraeota bacterium]